VRLKRLFDLLCILLGDTFLEHLRDRLNKLFSLKIIIISKKRMFAPTTHNTHLDEGEVRHDRLDLFNDLRLGTGVERLEPHVENRLFFRLGRFLRRRRIVCVCDRTRAGDRNRCTRCRECDFLDIQTRLELRFKKFIIGRAASCSSNFTLRSVTRSEAWSNVRADMSSTSLCSAGSDDGVGVVGGGGGDEEEGDASVVVVVASARAARRAGGVPRVLCDEQSEGQRQDLLRRARAGVEDIFAHQCRWVEVRRAKYKRVCMFSLGVERRPCLSWLATGVCVDVRADFTAPPPGFGSIGPLTLPPFGPVTLQDDKFSDVQPRVVWLLPGLSQQYMFLMATMKPALVIKQ
jgi:hypothetical protein